MNGIYRDSGAGDGQGENGLVQRKKNRLSKTRKEKSWCPGLTVTSGVGFVC